MIPKIIALCLIISVAQGITHRLSGDTVISIECTYDDQCATEDVIILAESGYKILITVTFVDIDGGSGDFLLIKSGTSLDDGLSGRIFTHTIKREREYISLTQEVLVRFVILGENEGGFKGYVLTAEHYGERITTLPPTTTEEPRPIPSEDDFPEITINLSVSDFTEDVVSSFREFILQLANDYVSNTDWILERPISAADVEIITTISCPTHWPNSENCVQVRFKLQILLAEGSIDYGTYQLNGTHLEAMWETASDYLVDQMYGIYKLPPRSYVIAIWMAVICSTILLFGLFYLVSGYGCTGRILRRQKKEAEEQAKLATMQSDRNSIISMSPPPFLPIPPLFDSDVTYYDPDSPGIRSAGRTEHDDMRDTLDSANLVFRTFSFNGRKLEEDTDT